MASRILVINDSEDILELFRELLEEVGYEVVLSSFGFQEASEVERIMPDLIILDYIIGGEKLGWQMLQQLKMRRATAGIPIIVCTGATQAVRDLEPSLIAKSVRLLPKPFDIDELFAAVAQGLRATSNTAHLLSGSAEEGPPDQREAKRSGRVDGSLARPRRTGSASLRAGGEPNGPARPDEPERPGKETTP